MKMLLIFIAGVLLISCGSKKAGNSNGGSNGGPTVPLPTVTIATDLEDITAANAANFMLSGTCSEEGQPVTVSVEDLNPETAPTCTNGAWMSEVDVSSLNSGPSKVIAITADHASSGGQNATQATGSVLLPPRVSVDTGLTNVTSTNASTFDVTGTCSDEGEAVTVSVETVNATTTCATGGTWTARVNLSGLSGGPLSITADHASSGGQSATQATGGVIAYLTFSIDDLEDITATNAGSFTVSGTCLEEGQPIEVSVGSSSISPGTDPDCTNGTWTIAMDVTGLNKTEGDTSVTADHSSESGTAHPQATASVTNEFICPTNYVGVPALADYTTNSFCVMKYEAKNTGSPNNNAVSQATGTLYVSINHADSIDKCTALGDGYDLITNDEWQSIARNIELVGDNWSTGVVGNAGGLSLGHSDNSPSNTLAASNDDTEGCDGTGQICSNTVWNSQRRTHTLSNGEVIWDMSGNVYEWIKDRSEFNYGDNSFISQVTAISHPTSNSLSNGITTISRNAKDQFGPSGDYTNLSVAPYGGLGYGSLNSFVSTSPTATYRSSYYTGSYGIFSVNSVAAAHISGIQGFRCVHRP